MHGCGHDAWPDWAQRVRAEGWARDPDLTLDLVHKTGSEDDGYPDDCPIRRTDNNDEAARGTNVVGATAWFFCRDENVQAFEPTMGAEDFSFFLQHKPGAYFVIGNGDGTHREGGHGLGPCTLHNPSYDFNDELIPLGGTLWVKMVQRWLAQP